MGDHADGDVPMLALEDNCRRGLILEESSNVGRRSKANLPSLYSSLGAETYAVHAFLECMCSVIR